MSEIVTKEIKIIDALELRNILESLKTTNVKFNYRVIRLKKQLNDALKDVDNMITPSEEFMKYESKRLNLLGQYGKRDENGKLIIQNDNVVIDEDKIDEFYEKINELKEEFKDAIKEREKQLREYEDFINTETIKIEFKPTKIDEIEGLDIPINVLEKLVEIDFIQE